MGFKRYISWNDAIHGYPGIGLSTNHYISKNCTMAT